MFHCLPAWLRHCRFRAVIQDLLISSCRIEKAFLFDVASKIYVASDSSPVDMQSFVSMPPVPHSQKK